MPTDQKAAGKSPNILLIQLRPAGDVLLLTPVVKAIKKSLPGSRISFMVNERESVIIKDFELIDDFILIKKIPKKGIADHLRYICYNLSINLLVRKNRYDIVLDFIGNPKSALITFMSGAPVRIGRRGIRSFAYNKKIEHKKKDINTVLSRLSHLKPLGIYDSYIAPELNLNPCDQQFGEKYLRSLNIEPGRPVIFIAPNSPRASRRWRAEYFAAISRDLIREYRAKILIAWGPGEEEYTKDILNRIGMDAEMIPPANLCEMAAIIAGADLMIANDSGPKHIANALGIRTITIYGPTNPNVWNDIDMNRNPALRADVPCIQCEKRECPMEEHICMNKLTPDFVMEAVRKILTKN